MTEEVLIELMSDPPPQGSLDLSPLGKTLVVALLNEDAYKKDQQAGRHLNPVQASSTVTAAYWYQPKIELKPQDITLELKADNESEKIKINLTDLLPSSTVEQEVPYWIGCENDDDLVNHFTPNVITDLMQPAAVEEKNKHLGVLTRLRVAKATYEAFLNKLHGADKEDSGWLGSSSNEIKDILQEKERELNDNLTMVRKRLVELLESYEVKIRGNTVQLVESIDDLINAMGAEDVSEQEVQEYGKLLVLKRHYVRLP